MVVVVAALGPVLRRHMWHPHGLRGLASARAPGPQLARVSDCDLKTIVEHCPSLEPDLILFWLSHLFLLSSLTSLFHHRSLCCCPALIFSCCKQACCCVLAVVWIIYQLTTMFPRNWAAFHTKYFLEYCYQFWGYLCITILTIRHNKKLIWSMACQLLGFTITTLKSRFPSVTSHTLLLVTSEVWLLPPLYCDSVTHVPRPRSSLMVLISSVFRIGRCILLSSFPHWPISVNCKV